MPAPMKACPHCGCPNTPWRQFCKHCRQSLEGARDLPPPAYVEETVRIYFSDDKRALLTLSALRVEYQTHHIHILTHWSNVKSLSHGFSGPYLLLREPALAMNDPLFGARGDFESRVIPLTPFGYPHKRDLVRDLRTLAPVFFG